MPRGRRFLPALLSLALLHAAGTRAQAPDTPEALALAGWDEETGIWFPPDAPRQVYLDRSDPRHFLITDVENAFKASPALARAIAALRSDPKRETSATRLSGSVRQLKTMFDMMVIGFVARETEEARASEAWRAQEKIYEGWMDLEQARTLSLADRRAAWQRLFEEAQTSEPDGALRRAFTMLGLSPQADLSVFRILATQNYTGTLIEPRFLGSLRKVLDRESSDGRPEAWRWRMALRNYLYYVGELNEARALSHRLLGVEDLAIWESDNRLFSALLDRLAGDPGPLRAAMAGCEIPEDCRGVIHHISARLLDRIGEKAPRAVADIFAEDAAAAPTDWPNRLDAIRHVAVLDPGRARAMAMELLEVPATIAPLGARLDAFAVVGRSSATLKEFSRAQGAWDRYLATLRYRPAPLPADAWRRLTPIPQQESGARAPDADGGWLEISYALQKKAEAAIAARDFPLARRSIEALMATAFAFADSAEKTPDALWKLVDLEGLSPEDRAKLTEVLDKERSKLAVTARDELRYVRSLLRDLGNALVSAGRTADARRVASYLLASPEKEHALFPHLVVLFYEARTRGEPMSPAPAPWEDSGR
ncbi:MAG TPA: hypothetical protein VKF32_07735 [Thermoanaerobaculia bacterium]|nr:hypothetical protein [Thermoanaerobaculia bacterium]